MTITVGQLGESANAEISEALSRVNLSMTVDRVSQLTLIINDPDLLMHSAGYFVIRRVVYFEGVDIEQVFEMSAVEVSQGQGSGLVTVEARSRATQQLKRDKGAASWSNLSPTQFASMKAKEFGMSFFGQPSVSKASIARTQNENTSESSWDVLRREAGELEYLAFEANNTLYFSSEKFLLNKAQTWEMNWPAGDQETQQMLEIPTLRRSDDDPYAATFQTTVDRRNGTKILPGDTVKLGGIPYFTPFDYLVTDVSYQEDAPNPISVSGRMNTEDLTPDVGCERKTFSLGNRDRCVVRIRQTLGLPNAPWYADSDLYDEVVRDAIEVFQAEKGLVVNGVCGPSTWDELDKVK